MKPELFSLLKFVQRNIDIGQTAHEIQQKSTNPGDISDNKYGSYGNQ